VGEAERDDETMHTLTLIKRAQGGELPALERLFARYYTRVGHLVRRRLGNRRYEIRSHADFMDWLGAIVENRIRNADKYARREKRDREREVALEHVRKSFSEGSLVIEPSAGLLPQLERMLKAEEKRLLWEVLEELPPEHRTVIVLRHFDKASWDEVAQALGKPSADAARMLYSRAKVQLKKRLEERLAD